MSTQSPENNKLDGILKEIKEEAFRAEQKYGKFRSRHEAYAVLLEESEELWETIRNKQPPERTHEEAVQVAAAVVCFILDLL